MDNLSRYEMETIISYNEAEDIADIYTASKAVMRKLDKLCERYPDTYYCTDRNEYSATYICPVDRCKFANPVSEKQRQALIANGSKTRF